MLREGASAYERIYKESEKKIFYGKIKFTWRMGMRNGAWGMGWDVLVDPNIFLLIYPVCTEYVIRDRAIDTKKHMVQRHKEKGRKRKEKRNEKEKKNKLRLCHRA